MTQPFFPCTISAQSRINEFLTIKTVVRKTHQNNGHTGSSCLDKAVLAQGRGIPRARWPHGPPCSCCTPPALCYQVQPPELSMAPRREQLQPGDGHQPICLVSRRSRLPQTHRDCLGNHRLWPEQQSPPNSSGQGRHSSGNGGPGSGNGRHRLWPEEQSAPHSSG